MLPCRPEGFDIGYSLFETLCGIADTGFFVARCLVQTRFDELLFAKFEMIATIDKALTCPDLPSLERLALKSFFNSEADGSALFAKSWEIFLQQCSKFIRCPDQTQVLVCLFREHTLPQFLCMGVRYRL